jgi:dienelactone hydrolase
MSPDPFDLARWLFVFMALACSLPQAQAVIAPEEAVLFFDFRKGINDLAGERLPLQLHGVKSSAGEPLTFTDVFQFAEVDEAGMQALARKLADVQAMTIGGWYQTRRDGEQLFFCRGVPEIAPLGERMFRPSDKYVNFLLGTDQHGFLMGTINGNGVMPFPYVTINSVPINTWNQLVVVKTADGHHKFYQNGVLIHSDHESCWSGRSWPFHEAQHAPPVPVRLCMPLGGMIGEAWIFARELEDVEVQEDYRAKRDRYKPAHAGERIELREMVSFPQPHAWKRPLTAELWPADRVRILAGVEKILGKPPASKVALDPRTHSEEDCGNYRRRKVSILVEPDDRMPAYLLIPKSLKRRVPAVICFYGTTSGAGKLTTVGLSGPELGSPPHKNRNFAVDMVEAGFVAFAADYLRDGERMRPGNKPYDSSEFYRQHPDWSIVGKDAWDNSRAVDYLQTLDFVDSEKIGMVGHSYGGHSTIFAAALEPRIKVAVANGPVSDFLDHGLHWGRPIGSPGGEYIRGLRPYVLDHTLPIPVTFSEFTSLIAPRPLLVGEAIGERRPKEEENYAAVREVYQALGHPERVRYHWYAGDHDFPPAARQAAIEWFRRWFKDAPR